MRFSSRTKRLIGSAVAVASLGVAVPLAATGTAQADPNSGRVKVSGTVSCERFEDASPDAVTITPKGKTAKADQLPGEDVAESFSLTFTQVPKKGLSANAKVTCVDDDGDKHTFGKSFKITRPPGTTETQAFSLK
ncbi:hypothetical protein [Streptomyces chromofuscus]|uniref:Secreted protein n=1 Tax=Streptomyces chromofuscus TaxID=42881 RepID=A0A7M2THN6_STRCW|nr:hypothetical protein [Streptomyces chromofuscus]QOV47218.1 hypothetical protein IPT68_15880 [Streptomyces chromofuscus]